MLESSLPERIPEDHERHGASPAGGTHGHDPPLVLLRPDRPVPLRQRALDVVASAGLLLVLAPLMGLIALIIAVRDGAPVFYVSERMKTPRQSFGMVKFRTMALTSRDWGVTGGDKDTRITPTGAFLRRHRLDELPQLLNILRGDMSFVGPRPPLRRYVEMFPDLYARVLESRPGATGLATLTYQAFEERLLASCTSAEETETVYTTRCVPRKARLDLIHQENRSLCFDLKLILATVYGRVSVGARRRRSARVSTALPTPRVVPSPEAPTVPPPAPPRDAPGWSARSEPEPG